MIRQFHLTDENGLSTTDIALEIGPAYSKIRADLEVMVENWNNFIRLAVILKDPQPVTVEERENLKREIDQQNEKINDYRRSVDIIKLENLDTFKKIENNSKSFQVSQGQLKENKLRSELRPTPLTTNSTLPEIKTFLRNFTTYIQSGNDKLDQLPEGLVFEVASTNADSFWMKMFEGWGFCEKTTLQEFIFMVNTISKTRFSIGNRRLELFGLKQENEDTLEFLDKVNDLVINSDW